jgi:hypothetical protein
LRFGLLAGKSQQLCACDLQQGPEARRVEGIPIDDQVPEACKRSAGRGVGEVARDLGHPLAVGRHETPVSMNASCLGPSRARSTPIQPATSRMRN